MLQSKWGVLLKRKLLISFVFFLGVGVLGFFLYNYRYGDTTIPEIAHNSHNYSSADSLISGYIYVIEEDQQVRINLIEDEAKKIIDALSATVVNGTDVAYSPKHYETQYLISIEDPVMQTEHISFSIYRNFTENEDIIFPFIVARLKPEQYIAKTDHLYKTIISIVSQRASSN